MKTCHAPTWLPPAVRQTPRHYHYKSQTIRHVMATAPQPPVFQGLTKGRLLHANRLPFVGRKATFWKTKDNLPGSSANLLDEYVGIVQTYPLDSQAHPLPSEALGNCHPKLDLGSSRRPQRWRLEGVFIWIPAQGLGWRLPSASLGRGCALRL